MFIDKAKKVHGTKYAYDKCVYVSSHSKVTVTCAKHGDFDITATNHLSGKGCPACGVESRSAIRKELARSRFTDKASNVHQGFYDYSKTEYVKASEKVVMTCPIHGDFKQTPNSHLNGSGCPLCGTRNADHKGGAKKRADATIKQRTENFIKLARELHGDKYDYSLVDYKNSKSKVKIICPEHGVFEQKATGHVDTNRGGKGCPTCGLRREYPNGYVYVLYGEGKTKIGITHDPKERFRKLKERTPFEFESVGAWFCVTYDMTFKVEAVLHRHFEEYSANLKGFDGAKEWFNMAPFEACDLLTAFLGAPTR